jgi:hypothetical protein
MTPTNSQVDGHQDGTPGGRPTPSSDRVLLGKILELRRKPIIRGEAIYFTGALVNSSVLRIAKPHRGFDEHIQYRPQSER